MKLYELNYIIQNSITFDEETGDLLNPSTGEIYTPDEFEEIKLARKEKIENLLFWMRNLEADAVAYKAEKERFLAKQQEAEQKAEHLKKFVKKCLAGEKFTGKYFNVTYRKTQSVAITDPTKIPDDYWRYKDPEPDKAKIKQAIKDGITIKGATILTNENMIVR